MDTGKQLVVVVGDRARPAWLSRIGTARSEIVSEQTLDSVMTICKTASGRLPNSSDRQAVVVLDLDNLWTSEREIENWVAGCDVPTAVVCSEESIGLAKKLVKYGVEYLRFETITVRDWDLCLERVLARHGSSVRNPSNGKSNGNATNHIQTIEHVAHDLRAPLAVIADYSEILQRQLKATLNKDQSRMVNVLGKRAEFMSDLIDDLLLTRKTQHGKVGTTLEPVGVGESLKSLALDLDVRGASRRVHCELDLPDSLPQMFCDRDHIQRILSNLGTNALKHSPAGEVVSIAAEHRVADGTVEISIADGGPGIPRGEQKRILERFAQSGTNEMQLEAGYGLGLHIVSELVKRNNGQLLLESETGMGSRFSVVLPTADPARLFESFVAQSVSHSKQSWISLLVVKIDDVKIDDTSRPSRSITLALKNSLKNTPENALEGEEAKDSGLVFACDERTWAVASIEGGEEGRREFALSKALEELGVVGHVQFAGCWSPTTHSEHLFRCWNDLFGLDLAATSRIMIQQQEALQRDTARVKSPIQNTKPTTTLVPPVTSKRAKSRGRKDQTLSH